MAIDILPAVPEDAEEFFPVGEAAFANDLLSNKTFSTATATAEELAEYRSWRIDLSKLRMSGHGKHYLKAVDDATGRIVGYLGMYSPGADMDANSKLPRPSCVNVHVDDELRRLLPETKKKTLGDRQDVWCMLPVRFEAFARC